MSEEQLKAFIAKAKDDQSIQAKLKSAKTPEDVVGIAKEHGYKFTADKITALSEEELEGVAGGTAGAPCNEGNYCVTGYGNNTK
jgi:predicted ribosomally synthesized peptide with nif11-like leader